MRAPKNLVSGLSLLPAITLAVLIGILVLQIRLLESNASWVDHADKVISGMNNLLRLIVDQETGIRGYLLTGEPEFLEPYNWGRAQTRASFADLQNLLANDPQQLQRLRELDQAHNEWEEFATKRLDTPQSHEQVVADGLAAKHRMDHIRVLASEFIAQEARIRAQRSLHSTFLSGVTLVTFILIGFVTAGIAIAYTRRLRQSRENFRELATRYVDGEEALRESESRYRTLFESIDEGFCIVQMIFDEHQKPIDYRFLEVNHAFSKQTGLENVKGRNMRSLAPKHEQHWFDIYGRVAVTGEPIRMENRADQLNRWYDVYAFRFGRPEDLRVAILFNDITQRRLSEQALIKAEKLAVTGRIASTIAHEVNNPLGAALNSLYLAQLDRHLSDEAREYISLAERELERVAHITKQTLGFFREFGTPRKVDIREIANTVVNLFSSKLNGKAIRVEQRYATDVRSFAVESEVKHILSNVLSNSIDAVSQGGTIHLRTSCYKMVNEQCPELCLTVSDDGEGIEPQHMKEIFEPFYSTKPSTGTGLGLWVTQQLVRKHGGRIRVRSKPGVGTVVQIILPTERRKIERLEDQDLQTTA